ncbi:MAG: mechanosensitive ion channel family protein [Verrucomicrobia bacterium]|nr:mechanosensitive ion channel family protein [Verrucomicrobiota bacterium]
MKSLYRRLLLVLVLAGMGWPSLGAAEAAADAAPASEPSEELLKTAAAAATLLKNEKEAPDFLEHVVDSILRLFNVSTSGNTVTHYAISALLFVVALLARRIVTRVFFPILRRLAAKTETTLDDKLFPALEGPAAAFVMMVGLFSSLRVLKLSSDADFYISRGSQVGFSLVIFWGLWRALAALLEHGNEVAQERGLGIAAFMPWIRKSLLTVFAILAVLLTIQSLGFDVKAILAGLGIGGLAFALAAQDTIANIFGAIVVAVDQPFKIGETVRIGANVGTIEDIGLRSTRIRLVDKSLMVIPNKTVASDTITNLSRFTRRRFEQVLGLTYASRPEQLQELIEAIREIVQARPEVDRDGVMVYFRDFSASSLDLWLVYEVLDADFKKAMKVKQEVNLALMQAVAARGLAFAYPTQTVELTGAALDRIAAAPASNRAAPR